MLIRQIKNQTDLIVTNFANGDVIGHTSNREAKIKCAEVIDQHLKKVFEAALEANYVTLITADHGNLEELLTEEGSPHVSHTTNPVPFLIIDPQSENRIKPEDGKLSDVAPTLLHILGVDQPSAMDGKRLTPAHHFGEKRKAILIILDGWGISHNPENDPILIAEYPLLGSTIRGLSTCRITRSWRCRRAEIRQGRQLGSRAYEPWRRANRTAG